MKKLVTTLLLQSFCWAGCALDESGRPVLWLPSGAGSGGETPDGSGQAGAGVTGGAGYLSSTGGAGGLGTGSPGSLGGLGGAPDSFCGLGGPPADWQYLQPQLGSGPVPAGLGGTIIPGTYKLSQFKEYGNTSQCLVNSGNLRYQALNLGSHSGTLIDEDNNFLHWPLTFDYATAGAYIVTAITCSPYGGDFGVNKPYGPFGPFETYTASNDTLELFSPQCQYSATFARVNP